MSHLFCFGLGYSASVVARRLAADGWQIAGTSTNSGGVVRIAAQGHTGFKFDGRTRADDVAHALSSATHLLLSIPPTADGDPALNV